MKNTLAKAKLDAAQALALMGVAILDMKRVSVADRLTVAKVVAARDITPNFGNDFKPMDILPYAIGWTTLLDELYAVVKRTPAPTQSKQITVNQWIKSVDEVRDLLPRQRKAS